MNKTLPILGYTCYAGWGGLGFIRGVNSYTYHTFEKTQPYIYIHLVMGVGILFYMNPFLLPLSVYKEIYRL